MKDLLGLVFLEINHWTPSVKKVTDRIKRKTLSELSVLPLTKIPGSAHAFTSGEFHMLLNLKTATRPKAMCIFAVENAILAIRNPQRVETMRGSRNFCQGRGGGGGSRPDCQKTALTTSLLNYFLF